MQNANVTDWKALREIRLAVWRAKQRHNPIKIVPFHQDMVFLDGCPGCRNKGKSRRRQGEERLQCALCGGYYYDYGNGYKIVEESKPQAFVGYVRLTPEKG